MHWQVEAWKCAQPRLTSTGNSNVRGTKSKTRDTSKRQVVSKTLNECGKVCYRREQFQAHLSSDHKISDDIYIKEQCKLRRIGRNGHEGFWCGFCQTVIMVEKKNHEAFDERFTHIDSKHFDKGQRVEDWFPMEGDLPRGLLSAPAEEAEIEEEFEGPVSNVADGENSGSDPEDDVLVLSEEPIIQSEQSHVRNRARASHMECHAADTNVQGKTWFCVSPVSSYYCKVTMTWNVL